MSISFLAKYRYLVLCFTLLLGNCRPLPEVNAHFDVSQVGHHLFIDKEEVSNQQYRNFVKWVTDSLAHTYLDHYIEDEETGEDRVDWEYKINWNDPVLKELFKPGSRVIDESKLVFEYQWYDWKEKIEANDQLPRNTFLKTERTRIFPDLSVWEKGDTEGFNGTSYYQNPYYNDFPVVGVNYNQAKAYCSWRTKMLASGREAFPLTILIKSGIPDPLKYRLPTPDEWELAARAKIISPTNKDRSERYVEENFFHMSPYNQDSTKHIADLNFPSATTAYPPDQNGVYHLWGNVAEITSVPGIAKGGSWKDQRDEITLDTEIKYNSPKAWLGFRCICSAPVTTP